MQRTGALLWGIVLAPSLRPLNTSISCGLLVNLLTCRLGFRVPAVVVLAARVMLLVVSPVALLPGRLVPTSCPPGHPSCSLALLTHIRLHSNSPLVLQTPSSVRIRDASRGLVGGPFVFSTCF